MRLKFTIINLYVARDLASRVSFFYSQKISFGLPSIFPYDRIHIYDFSFQFYTKVFLKTFICI